MFAESGRAQIPTFEFMSGVWISAAVALTPIALASGESFTAIPLRNWPSIVALAIVPGLGHVMMNWGHRFVDAPVSSVISILKAPVGTAAALVILGQSLSLIQICCGSVATVAIVLMAKGRSRPIADAIDPVAITD